MASVRKSIPKQILCFVLCFTVLIFALSGIIPQAKALTGIEEAVGIGVIAAYLLIAAGLTWASTGDGQQAVDQFVEDCGEVIETVKETARAVYDSVTGEYKLVCPIADGVWNTTKEYVNTNYDVGTNSETSQAVYGNTSICTESLISGQNYYLIQDGAAVAEKIICKSAGHVYTYTLFPSSNYVRVGHSYPGYGELESWTISYTGTILILRPMIYSTTYHVQLLQYVNGVFGTRSTSDYEQVELWGAAETLAITGTDVVDLLDWDYGNALSGERAFTLPLTESMDYTGVLVNGEVLEVDEEAVMSATESMTYDDVITQDLSGVEAAESEVVSDEALTDAQTLEEIISGSESETSLKALFFSKFPFCLPFDLKNAVELIAARGEAPKWEIDFLSQLSIPFAGSTKFVLDMGEYPEIGMVCRWTSTIGFCIALIVLTRKIIHS